jgi:formylglycine-generating enzyme required for sulfatase activity
MKDSTNPVNEKNKKDESGGFLKTPMIFPDRVFRGGICFNYPFDLRVSNRDNGSPAYRNGNIGFRLVKNKSKT